MIEYIVFREIDSDTFDHVCLLKLSDDEQDNMKRLLGALKTHFNALIVEICDPDFKDVSFASAWPERLTIKYTSGDGDTYSAIVDYQTGYLY